MTTLPPSSAAGSLGPHELGLEIVAHEAKSEDEHAIAFVAPARLAGPPGFLQGGLCAGALLAAARAVDPFGAPATHIDVRLHAPTPLEERIVARVRRVEAADYEVSLTHGDDVLVTGSLSLAGRDAPSGVGDLRELARVPLPEPVPQTGHAFKGCWVCGYDNPDGLQLLPGWPAEGRIVTPWVPDAWVADEDTGEVAPEIVCAVLDCPTAFASWHELEASAYGAVLLAGYRVTFHEQAPVATEPLRTVAMADGADGRKLRARSALVDEEGVVYATAHGLWIAVNETPTRA